MERCDWADGSDLLRSYHDNEWGVEVHDDRTPFEFLVLEGAQAGLSWSTILRKREAYRKALDNFDARKVANYSEKTVARLLANPEIIRTRNGVRSCISTY